MRHGIVGLLCAVLSCAVLAAGPDAVRKREEATMLVTGRIDVMPDGSVHGYSIDRPEKVPAAVTDLIQKNVPNWKFKIADNSNVIEQARMNLRIVAKPTDDGQYAIRIASSSFGEQKDLGSEYVSAKDRAAPKYPLSAEKARVDGTVYLFLRVGRQGQVEDAVAEQVNLRQYGSDMEMQRYRDVLADAALKAAKTWTFNTPTTGKHVADAYWNVRVPVAFNLKVRGAPEDDTYGKWQGYIPGPRQPIPWAQKTPQLSISPDAIPAGSISQADQNLQLMTPPAGA